MDLRLQGEVSTAEFKSRVEEGEQAREIEEQLGKWSIEAIEEEGFS